jgi:hypothetical protein
MARALNKTELDICGQLFLHIKAGHDRVNNLNLEKLGRLMPDRDLGQAMVEDVTTAKEALGRILATLEKLIDETPKKSGQTPWKPGDLPSVDLLSSTIETFTPKPGGKNG